MSAELTIEETAWHEAGHALATLGFGGELEHVLIREDRSGECLPRYEKTGEGQFTCCLGEDAYLYMCCAGVAAEYVRFCELQNSQGRALSLLTFLRQRMYYLRGDLNSCIKVWRIQEQRDGSKGRKRSECAMLPYVEYMVRLFEQLKDILRLVAAALIEHRTLTGEQLKSLVWGDA